MTGKAHNKKTEDEAALLAAIAAMPEHDRVVGERLHNIITENAPELLSRTWYGMPAYHDGKKIVCFFRSGAKFGERYMTLGFNDVAKLDDGNMWPINFAIIDLSETVEAVLASIIKKAVR